MTPPTSQVFSAYTVFSYTDHDDNAITEAQHFSHRCCNPGAKADELPPNRAWGGDPHLVLHQARRLGLRRVRCPWTVPRGLSGTALLWEEKVRTISGTARVTGFCSVVARPPLARSRHLCSVFYGLFPIFV